MLSGSTNERLWRQIEVKDYERCNYDDNITVIIIILIIKAVN